MTANFKYLELHWILCFYTFCEEGSPATVALTPSTPNSISARISVKLCGAFKLSTREFSQSGRPLHAQCIASALWHCHTHAQHDDSPPPLPRQISQLMICWCAGIMPIMTYGGFMRMTSFCKTAVPQASLFAHLLYGYVVYVLCYVMFCYVVLYHIMCNIMLPRSCL